MYGSVSAWGCNSPGRLDGSCIAGRKRKQTPSRWHCKLDLQHVAWKCIQIKRRLFTARTPIERIRALTRSLTSWVTSSERGVPERVQGAYSSRASHLQSAQNLLRPCGHTRGGSIFAINHISVWENLLAFSIQSSGAGSLTTGNSIPLRCGRYTGTPTTRYVPGSCENTAG